MQKNCTYIKCHAVRVQDDLSAGHNTSKITLSVPNTRYILACLAASIIGLLVQISYARYEAWFASRPGFFGVLLLFGLA